MADLAAANDSYSRRTGRFVLEVHGHRSEFIDVDVAMLSA